MMRPARLGRYLTRLFLGQMVAVLLGLAALLQTLDLLDKASDVLADGSLADIGRYAALRLPTTIERLIPLAVLVGAILTFRRLARSLEITAMRAAGIGTWGILGALLPACALAAAVQFGLALGVAPRTERALVDWWDRRQPAGQPIALPRRLWLRDGRDIVAVDAVSRDGRVMAGVLLVRRDAAGRAVAWIEARRAAHGPAGWRLEEASLLRPGEGGAAELADLPWPEGPAPETMRSLARPTEAQTLGRLLAANRGEGPLIRGPDFHATRLQGVAALGVAPFVMLLLAAPAASGLPRQDGGARRAAIGLVLGLGYLVTGGLLMAIGEAGGLGPVAAAWVAPLGFAMIGLMALWRAEG
jgi:lipopolysaccharide export system permease protein